MRQTDKNILAENILVSLLSVAFGYPNLRNLNNTDDDNYPGIDLADDVAGVAIQVTSTPDSEKIKHTLEKFVQHKQYQKYKRLIIYILVEKQARYTGKGYDEIIGSTFQFDKDNDILDYRDLLHTVNGKPFEDVRRVELVLEEHFGPNRTITFGRSLKPLTETVYLNLIECVIPDKIYIADLNLPRTRDFGMKHGKGRRGRRFSRTFSQREQAQVVLKEMGHRFAVDWECHGGQLITFHDLNNEYMPLAQLVDEGTITEITPKEFYSSSDDNERVFKYLLRRCLQQMLYSRKVHWQHEEHLFIFTPNEEGDRERKVSWANKKISERTVYETTTHEDDPSKVWYCKHFAFEASFKLVAGRWFLSVRPDWFFSYDGYRRYSDNAGKVSWLKRQEANGHVYNHLMFLTHFLTTDVPEDFLRTTQARPYQFLKFINAVSFDNAEALDDDAWLPSKKEKDAATQGDNETGAKQQEMDFGL